MPSEYTENTAGMNEFRRRLELQYAEIAQRVARRLPERGTMDDLVDDIAAEYAKQNVTLDKVKMRRALDDLSRNN